MKEEPTFPQKKLRLLGNFLLVVSCLGLLAGLAVVPISLSIESLSEDSLDPETEELIKSDPELADSIKEAEQIYYEMLLPEGVSMDTTVRELLEYDQTFFDENRGWYYAHTFVSAFFILGFAVVCLLLALSWRRAEAFGRRTILGLRFLGLFLVLQFVVGEVVGFFFESWHTELFFWSDLYEISAVWLVYGGPTLSSGILFLILSWVLDYGRRIKEEQALTI